MKRTAEGSVDWLREQQPEPRAHSWGNLCCYLINFLTHRYSDSPFFPPSLFYESRSEI
jgi:hypothetical protein